MYTLIWQSAQALVAYKKPGASFHSETGSAGFFETLRQREGLDELYPVHRLDRVTSGLVVMARTAAANRELCQQFAQRQCEKFYLALSAKKPLKKQGCVAGDMQPARDGNWRLLRSHMHPAITRFYSRSLCPGRRLFVVKPLTGKTHQIRVALKSLGAPILGDSRYGGAAADRTYLHAYSLGFTLAGQFLRFTEAPREGEFFMDGQLQSALATMTPPWEHLWPGR